MALKTNLHHKINYGDFDINKQLIYLMFLLFMTIICVGLFIYTSHNTSLQAITVQRQIENYENIHNKLSDSIIKSLERLDQSTTNLYKDMQAQRLLIEDLYRKHNDTLTTASNSKNPLP